MTDDGNVITQMVIKMSQILLQREKVG